MSTDPVLIDMSSRREAYRELKKHVCTVAEILERVHGSEPEDRFIQGQAYALAVVVAALDDRVHGLEQILVARHFGRELEA